MSDINSSKRWIVRGRRAIVILLVLIIVVFAVRAVFDVWMGRRLENEIARLEKQYGPLRYDPVRKLDAWKKWPMRIAPDNRARVMDAAAASITASSDKMDIDLINGALRTPKGDVARAIAEQNREAVQLAIRASHLQHSNWEVTYLGEIDNVPDLADMMRLSKVLVSAAESDADAGRPDDAMADLAAGFALAAAMRSEPAVVMTVNAFSKAYQHVDALKDILPRIEPSRDALANLARAIDENAVDSPVRDALLGELKHSRFEWPLIERGWLFGRRFLDHSTPKPPTWWMRTVGWFFRPVIRYMATRDLSERARAVDVASTPRMQRPGEMLPTYTTYGGSKPSTIQMAAGLADSGDRYLAAMRLTAITVALRQFRLEHSAYPNSLDELVPTYFKSVPLDPFTGKQPEYARDGAGFVLRARIPEIPLPPGAIRTPGFQNPAEWKLPR